tara:strand:- start:915 stop:2075 length:1161 start_codon:yes stop_codon:yes gene_type:complete
MYSLKNDTHKSFWEKLQKDSPNFRKPVIYKNILSKPDKAISAVYSVIKALCEVPAIRDLLSIRLYIDGKSCIPNDFLKNENTPYIGEDLDSWGKRIFKSREFCLIIARASRCSEEIARATAMFFEHFCMRFLPEEISQDIHIYLGNYSATPFGVHVDRAGVNILHFHLGPETKSMFLWEKKSFEQLVKAGKNYYGDLSSLPKINETFCLESGDVFFLPAADYYHVGKNTGFSIALTLGFYLESANTHLKRAVKSGGKYTNEHLPEQDEREQALSSIDRLALHYSHKKASNAYFPKPAHLFSQNTIKLSKTICVVRPFFIIVHQEYDKLYLYARGRLVDKSLPLSFLPIIESINEGGDVDVSTSLWEGHTEVIRQLLHYQAIETVEP